MSPTCSAKSGETASGCCSTDIFARSRGLRINVLMSNGGGTITPSTSRHSRGGLGFGFDADLLDRFPAPLTRPAHAKVDAAGMKRLEHPEALDDGDGRRLAELHRGGADANRVGGGGDLADQHRRLCAGHGDEVVLGDPVALVSPLLGVLGEVDGVAQSRCGVGSLR